MKNFKIYVIQHSHTDIGYTERQEKLMRYHKDFIVQAIDILNDIHSGALKGCEGFKWQCENHWQVENFYASATEKEKADFEKYVLSGELGLSGNYLNLNELIDFDVLSKCTNRAKVYGESIKMPVSSAMTADINGYAWGYADALYDNGIENLFCNLHSHHGMFPLYKKQQPFYWKTPKGNKLLVWIGEHYHFGTELFLSPEAGSSYILHDDIRLEFERNMDIRTKVETVESYELSYAQTRILRYLKQLEDENYPYDFVPHMIAGANTDNSPPNYDIAKRINQLNEIFAGKVTIEMVTLEQFFSVINKADIPTYSGDFPDWWADGVGSAPLTLKVFRDAQRKYNLCQKLDPDMKLGSKELFDKATDNIMLYSEHTYGYSSSISDPCDSLAVLLEKKKDGYAINANNDIATNLDLILSKLGETAIAHKRVSRHKIINPHTTAYKGTAKIYVEGWEYIDGTKFDSRLKYKVYNEKTGEVLKSQGFGIPRAYEFEVLVDLKPQEEIVVRVALDTQNNSSALNHAYMGSEGVADIVNHSDYLAAPFLVETDAFKVIIEEKKGISSIIDKVTNNEICDTLLSHGAFSAVYEVTSASGGSSNSGRRRMGRNRCSFATKRDYATLINSEIIAKGDLYVTLKLSYKLDGTNFYNVFLKIYNDISLIEAKVQIHKTSCWDAENLYITLPFVTDGSNETYIDKTGCILRPGIDQLPGTCQEFYLMQNAIVRCGDKLDITVSVKDAPLVSFGERVAKPIKLCTGDNVPLNTSTMYSWVMNNFWETNFKLDLGGFHEFTYYISTEKNSDIAKQIEKASDRNQGLIAFYIK